MFKKEVLADIEIGIFKGEVENIGIFKVIEIILSGRSTVLEVLPDMGDKEVSSPFFYPNENVSVKNFLKTGVSDLLHSNLQVRRDVKNEETLVQIPDLLAWLF